MQGQKELAQALLNNTSLTVLNLGSNKIGDAGAEKLAQVLAKNTRLTMLELFDNDSNASGQQHIGLINVRIAHNKLLVNPSLSMLDL